MYAIILNYLFRKSIHWKRKGNLKQVSIVLDNMLV